jgi:chromosomal replication initiation ATPase DnaA
MNHALQTVVDYINEPETDFALFIAGPWGCGKTHFWKHTVVPELKRLHGDSADRRFLSASLYGVAQPRSIG